MSWRRAFSKLQGLFRGRRPVDDLEEEIRSHLKMEEQENLESGMSQEEAHYAAMRRFGNVTLAQERSREVWGWNSVETLWQDVRYALRQTRRRPGFTLLATLTLALGIGANTAIFSVVYAVMLRPLPYFDPGRLVMLWQTFPKQGWPEVPFSAADFIDVQKQNRVFEQSAALFLDKPDYNLTGQGEPERVYGMAASANLFSLLGSRAELGRVFLAGEDQPGREHVAVLSHRLWQHRFSSDPRVIGKAVELDAQAYTVVGVMPPGFRFPPPMGSLSKSFPNECDIWLPLVLDSTNRHYHPVAGVARMKPGVTVAQARAEVDAIEHRLAAQYPENDTGLGATALGLSQQLAENVRPALLMLSGAVALVLLIACVNVANLLLARSIAREREMAVRAALGASRVRTIRQLLVESVLLSILGGALGVLQAVWGIGIIRSLGSTIIPRASEVGLNGSVLAFTGAIALLTGLIFGMIPALRALPPNLNEFLKAGRGPGLVRHQRFRSGLASAELALAVILLIGAGLLIRSFIRLQEVNPGFRTDHLLTMSIRLPEAKYPKDEQVRDFYQQLLLRVRALPGVRAAGLVNSLPIAGWQGTTVVYVEGRPAPASMLDTPMANYRVASSDYFSTLGIPLLRGRLLTERDTAGSPQVMVINETLAQRLFPNQDPVGQQIHRDSPKEPAYTIMGVVGDVRSGGLDAPVASEMYTAHAQDPWNIMTLAVRTASSPLTLASAVRDQVWALDKDQPVFDVRSMDEILSESALPRRFNMLVLGLFSGLAVVLAVVGIYGVVSYSVSQRTNEIGIRMALGAEQRTVQTMVMREGLALAIIGIGGGLAAAFALTRLLSGLLFAVRPYDLFTFCAVPLLLTVVALAASYLPARRATKVDPMVALRYE